jgi:hypothetical protein
MDWPGIGPGPSRWHASDIAIEPLMFSIRIATIYAAEVHNSSVSSHIIRFQSMGCDRFLKSSVLGDHGSTSIVDFIHIKWSELVTTYFHKIYLLLKSNVQEEYTDLSRPIFCSCPSHGEKYDLKKCVADVNCIYLAFYRLVGLAFPNTARKFRVL